MGSQEEGDKAIREFIKDWPYTPQYLQATLDPDLIAEHGESVLRRAMNNGRIVCFVGSGVSMAYGRIGWGALVRAVFNAEVPGSGASSNSYKQLSKTLVALKPTDRSSGESLQSGRYPAVFQFQEQLEIAADESANYDGISSKFRKRVRELLFDDTGHARILFKRLAADLEALQQFRTPAGIGANKTEWPSAFAQHVVPELADEQLTRQAMYQEEPPPGHWRSYFQADEKTLRFLRMAVRRRFINAAVPGKEALWLLRSVSEALQAHRLSRAAPEKSLLPLHRFVLTALLRLTFDRNQLEGLKSNTGADEGQYTKAEAEAAARKRQRAILRHGISPEASRARSDVVPPERDPLMLMAGGLGIGRFITTNYDLDIERLLRDRGFAPGPGRAGGTGAEAGTTDYRAMQSTDPLGSGARDTVFNGARAAELVDFAVYNPDHAFNVVHLHGRATEGDDLIVTERDYLRRYLQRGNDADLIDISISLAFGANPILFVGSGMNEDDILRPLRQFVADRKSQADRKAVVLLPAASSRAREIEDKISLYSRFGVYTIHFGFAIVAPHLEERAPAETGLETAASKAMTLPWLSLILAMVRDLEQFLKRLAALLGAAEVDGLAQDEFEDVTRQLARMRLMKHGQAVNSVGLTPTWIDILEWTAPARSDSGANELKAATPGASRKGRSRRSSSRADSIDTLRLRPVVALDSCAVDQHAPLNPGLEQALLQSAVRVVVQAAMTFAGVDLLAAWDLEKGAVAHIDSEALLAAASSNGNQPEQWMRLIQAQLALLSEIPDALMGLCLCAKLTHLRTDWLSWKVRREELPKARPSGGPRWILPAKVTRGESIDSQTRIIVRHPIALADVGDSSPSGRNIGGVPPGDRFVMNSPSRTFETLKSAMHRAQKAKAGSALSQTATLAGRRIFVLLARRGVGKGHFFESLHMTERVHEFVDASWPEKERIHYAACAYFNLSFCHEVVSMIDRLTSLLVDRAHRVFGPRPEGGPGAAERIWNANVTLRHNRVGRLSAILGLYHQHARHARSRVLVAFNGFNFMFDERGNPKNAQLFRIVKVLLDVETQGAPIDLLLVCTEAGLPRFFRQLPPEPSMKSRIEHGWASFEPIVLEHLIREDVSDKGRRELDAVVRRLSVQIGPRIVDNLPGNQPSARTTGAFFHVLRDARASMTLSKYFLEVALGIAARAGQLHGYAASLNPDSAYPINPRSEAPMDTLRLPSSDSVRELQAAILRRFSQTDGPELMNAVMPRLLRWLALYFAGKSVELGPLPQELYSGTREKMEKLLKTALSETPASPANPNEQAMAEAIDADFTYLFRQLDRSRFLLSIVGAAGEEIAWRSTEELGRVGRLLDTRRIVDWLRTTCAVHIGMTTEVRADALIASVLNVYRDRHEARSPLPERCGLKSGLLAALRSSLRDASVIDGDLTSLAGELAVQLSGPLGWTLQQRVLWHLAVVGHPVEGDVLAEAPKISKDCRLIIDRAVDAMLPSRPAMKTLKSFWQSMVKPVLGAMTDLLVHRCLIFRLLPVQLDVPEVSVAADSQTIDFDNDAVLKAWRAEREGKDTDEAAGESESSVNSEAFDRPWRFALHRYIQRSIFLRLHSPYVEYPHVDQFSLSMWATQPDDLPRPNTAATHDISDLMADWTGFPQNVAKIGQVSAFHRALRRAVPDGGTPPAATALTLPARMLRAAFGVVRSVYSVGVVSRFHELGHPGLPQAPEEGYFEQHRLQIRWLLECAVKLKRERSLDETPGANAPFFAEEIVWLYNECGLLCLVEGRLDSAAGLFRRALKATGEIEAATDKGALWSRIHLNLAVVDIERGRIRAAKAYLQAIKDMPDENPILRLLAYGFIGLAEYLAGNLDLAERIYCEVIEDLEHYRQSRSIAIFSRHLGELYRMRGQPYRERAMAAIDRSIARATQGGHEDIRQLAKLSRVRLLIQYSLGDDRATIQSDLDASEQYGVKMGMPRLLAETAYARASYLLNLGETHHAATVAATCLEIATSNNLKLRQVTALALLAKTFERRGMHAASEPLFARANELAESCEYTSARESVSRQSSTRH